MQVARTNLGGGIPGAAMGDTFMFLVGAIIGLGMQHAFTTLDTDSTLWPHLHPVHHRVLLGFLQLYSIALVIQTFTASLTQVSLLIMGLLSTQKLIIVHLIKSI